MSYNILLITSDYRGDHSAEVKIAIKPKESETIEALIARTLKGGVSDHIEIRVVKDESVP